MTPWLEALTAWASGAWRRSGFHRMSRRSRWVAFWAALIGLVLLIAVAADWDDIMRTGLDPKEPFQTYTPPPAPNYAKVSAWALLPAT
ncbi:MAG TPA: hypothetical protein VG960_02335, partial [Caulobacteraceae bacterium]|nr:hypothetical protein [Caulobacteraceae bacterium]